jgi:hypothetical protein
MQHDRDESVTERIQIVEERLGFAGDRAACGGQDTWASALSTSAVRRRLCGKDVRHSRGSNPQALETFLGRG